MPVEPKWVPRRVVESIHLDQVRLHGGLAGVRDEGMLDSALHRARQRWSLDPEADIAALAAAYGFGISRNHPFLDGNKRVAFVVMLVFLALNGWDFEAPEAEVVTAMLALAEGKSREEDFAAWVRRNMKKKR